MKFKPLWALVTVAAAILIYQVSTTGGPEEVSDPGLNPTERNPETASMGTLPDQRTPDRILETREEIRATVKGVVRDHLGSPRAGERIWILRPGERHPQVFGHAKDLLTVESDAAGEFELQLGPEDEWHFSLGAIGKCELTTAVRQFENGEHANVEIVIGGAAHLAVVVQNESAEETTIQPARIEIVRKTQPDDDRLIPFGAPPKPGFGLDPDAKPEPPAPWATSSALALRFDEEVLFPKLKLGDTYRVAVVLGDRTAVGAQTIVLKAGEDRIARCTLTEAGGELALAVKLETVPATAGTEPGFHWEP